MKEAILWNSLDNDKVNCFACSHRCIIQLEKFGICGVRKNIDGKLYSLVYEKPVSVNIDPVEKKPLYHFLPGTKTFSFGTVGCNFRCDFCQNWDISQVRGNEIFGQDMKLKDIVSQAIENGCSSISYTYNEPAIFIEFAIDTAKLAKKHGLKHIYVTNGYETKEALDILSKHIDAMNIDLKSFSDDFYKRLCGARLQPVLENIKRAHEKGIWTEITTLVIPGENDSEKELKNLAEFIAGIDKNIPWHISRFFPQYKMDETRPTSIETLQMAKKIGKDAGLNYVYIGNVSESSNTSCPKCNTLLIERSGYAVNDSTENGTCPKCKIKIPGVWNQD